MMNRNISILGSALLCLAGPSSNAAEIDVAGLGPNDLVITEYLANPVGVGDSDGEYFEIFNTTNHDIDLTGLIVRDDGSNQFTVAAGMIAPWSFAVFASADGGAIGLAPDYVYGSGMTLTNSDDEIGLYRPDDALINKVTYTDGDWYGPGVAHELGVLDAALATLTMGPTLGDDFVGATSSLLLGNFGSPGSAGNSRIDAPPVPLPASAWLFGSAVGVLGWVRRRLHGQPMRQLTAS
jgi:hypothetical protein